MSEPRLLHLPVSQDHEPPVPRPVEMSTLLVRLFPDAKMLRQFLWRGAETYVLRARLPSEPASLEALADRAAELIENMEPSEQQQLFRRLRAWAPGKLRALRSVEERYPTPPSLPSPPEREP